MKQVPSPLSTPEKKKAMRRTMLIYTGAFALLAIAIFGYYFLLQDRSLVRWTDGLRQHCTTLAYYGEYLRTILHNIFVEHKLEVPMFDFSIGLGHDIIATLHYYGIGEPLNLLSVFFPMEYTEYLYGFLMVFRMYLTGLFFGLYMYTKSQNAQAVVAGAISYALTSFTLNTVTHHPLFIIGLMYFPLIIWGIDRILEKKSPVLYICSLALTVVSSFYFAYMVCIFMVIYAAIRYLSHYRHEGFCHFAGTVGKFFVYTLNAMLLPMIIFLPQIYNTLSIDRLNVDYDVGLFYNALYYARLPDSITNSSVSERGVLMGFGGISVLGMLVCCVKAKKRKTILASLFVGGVFLLFPFFGHMLNGFGYVTNRWTWVLAMPASAAVVYVYDDLFELTAKDRKRLLLLASAWLLAICLISKSRSYITMLMLAVVFVALAIGFCLPDSANKKRIASRVLTALVVFSILVQANNLYSFTGSGLVANYIPMGEVYKHMAEDTASNTVSLIDDSDEFFRFDNYLHVSCNDAMLNDQNSTTFFLSLSSPQISQFMKELGYNIFFEQQYESNDHRLALQILTGSKYILGTVEPLKSFYYTYIENGNWFYSDVTVDWSENSLSYVRGTIGSPSVGRIQYLVLENDAYLPMGYTYDSVISREDWDQMTPIARQNALLQGAATDGVTTLPATQIDPLYKETDVLPLLQSVDGIEVDGNTIRVKDTDAKLTFVVPTSADTENYVYCEDVSFTPYSQYQNIEDQIQELEEQKDNALSPYGNEIDKYSAEQLAYNEKYASLTNSAGISFSSDATEKGDSIHYFMPSANFYSGYDSYLVNLGYLPYPEIADYPAQQTITISFSHPGEYTFSKINFATQKLDELTDFAQERKQDVLENVVVSDNTVSGTISLDTPKLLATQIPYSEGWRVFVDGEEAELVDVNTMFCGVMLDAGDHTVEFRYATPHWQLAVAMSAAGLVMLLVIALVWRKKHPKAAPAGIAAQPVAESASEESAVSDAAATATQGDAVAPDEIADTSATPDKTAGEALPPDEA